MRYMEIMGIGLWINLIWGRIFFNTQDTKLEESNDIGELFLGFFE